MHTTVYHSGPITADIMVVAEAPGKTEANRGLPLVGMSGTEHNRAAARHGWPIRAATYVTNVVKDYKDGNPDPTPEDIARWTPYLLDEVKRVNPKIIVTLGRFAARFFLGSKLDMRACNGVLHFGGEWQTKEDIRRVGARPNGDAVVVPIYHPDYGLHTSSGRVLVEYGYECVGEILKDLGKSRRDRYTLVQSHLNRIPDYRDVRTLTELQDYVSQCGSWDLIGFDTEGTPGDPWSWQISMKEGTGVTIRADAPKFADCVSYIQQEANNRLASWAMHNRSYDVAMGEEMGFRFEDQNVHDSMYMLYLLGRQAQGLKPAIWRHLGIQHKSFAETVGKAGVAKQVEWLERVVELGMPKPAPVETRMNDGSIKTFKPEFTVKSAERILKDIRAGKRDKNGQLTDPLKRWQNCKTAGSSERTAIKRRLRQEVEDRLGPMPEHSLGDIPLTDAINYATGDADYTLRLHNFLFPLFQGSKRRLYLEGMELAHSFEEMMYGGMPVDVDYCICLRKALSDEYWRLHTEIVEKYFEGEPFNPKSVNNVRKLLELRGLKSKKLSKKTKLPSTAKDAISHLRTKDPAIELMFQARERAHTISAFLDPIINGATPSPWGPWQSIKCQIQTTRTASRRIATKNPNSLGIPSKPDTVTVLVDDNVDRAVVDSESEPEDQGDIEVEELPVTEYSGLIVRDAFKAPPGYKLVVADLATIEVRIAAHVSQDPLLVESLREGSNVDWHRRTAARALKIPESEVTKDQRNKVGKIANFSIIYGCGGQSLWELFQKNGLPCWDLEDFKANNCELPEGVWLVPMCDEVCKDWMSTYHGVKTAIDNAAGFTRRHGYAEDMWGMRRYLPGIYAVKHGARNEAIRHAFSLWVQGGAQGCLQNSQRMFAREVRQMRDEGFKVWFLLQVHDELVMLCEEGIAERVEERLVWHLENSHGIKDPLVPILADSCIVDRWGKAK